MPKDSALLQPDPNADVAEPSTPGPGQSQQLQQPQQPQDLAEYLQRCIEQERSAIAREVHDDIGGALSAIHFDLAWIRRHSDDPAIQAHVDAATEMLHHAIGASQRIVQNLRPPILDQGLVAAVQWLTSDFERRTAVRTTFTATHETMPLSPAVQLVAYRTAQEALTNIGKHAQCSKASVELSDAENVLTLEISDNGRGLMHGTLDNGKSFGLKGLSERARTVGGWLDISSRHGIGTSIILSVPLPDTHGQPSAGGAS